MRVTFAFPTAFEARAFSCSGMARVLITGVGPSQAAREVSAYLDRESPEGLVLAGWAGALQPYLKRGDVVADADGERSFWEKHLSGVSHWGKIYTSQTVLGTFQEKQAWGVCTQALAVDMETAQVREMCRRRGVACVAVRAILDELTEELRVPPLERSDWKGVARYLLKNRRNLAELYRLYRRSRESRGRLRSVLAHVAVS
ncbi:MAG: hypothetical protein HY402_06795 [Elusimicrobia bacterium]|nr:hypothetical protein [Elusimicrobiota bacterium]